MKVGPITYESRPLYLPSAYAILKFWKQVLETQKFPTMQVESIENMENFKGCIEMLQILLICFYQSTVMKSGDSDLFLLVADHKVRGFCLILCLLFSGPKKIALVTLQGCSYFFLLAIPILYVNLISSNARYINNLLCWMVRIKPPFLLYSGVMIGVRWRLIFNKCI